MFLEQLLGHRRNEKGCKVAVQVNWSNYQNHIPDNLPDDTVTAKSSQADLQKAASVELNQCQIFKFLLH